MASTRLKWSEMERTLLLNHILDGVKEGKTFTQSIKDFSLTYNVPESSVSSQWNKNILPQNKMYVEVAKQTWKSIIKPEREAKLKAEKQAEKEIQKAKKAREKYRQQILKKPKQQVQLSIPTNKALNPKDKGLVIKVDANGMVQAVKPV